MQEQNKQLKTLGIPLTSGRLDQKVFQASQLVTKMLASALVGPCDGACSRWHDEKAYPQG